MNQQFLSHVCTLRFTCNLVATVLTSVLTIFVLRGSDLCMLRLLQYYFAAELHKRSALRSFILQSLHA